MTADQITTAAELDALPVGSVVLDRHADAWQKQEDTELLDEEGKRRESAWASTAWMVDRTAEQMFSGIPTDTSKYSRLGPFTVLYRPDRPAPQVDRETLVEHVSDWLAGSPSATHGVDSSDEGYSRLCVETDDEWRALAEHLADHVLALPAARSDAALAAQPVTVTAEQRAIAVEAVHRRACGDRFCLATFEAEQAVDATFAALGVEVTR